MKLPRGLVLPLAAGFMPVLLALVMFFEGVSLKAYQDGASVWTICYGHTAGVKRGDVATMTQCVAWLREDLQNSIGAVDKHLKADVGWLCRVAHADLCFRWERPSIAARRYWLGPMQATATALLMSFCGGFTLAVKIAALLHQTALVLSLGNRSGANCVWSPREWGSALFGPLCRWSHGHRSGYEW